MPEWEASEGSGFFLVICIVIGHFKSEDGLSDTFWLGCIHLLYLMAQMVGRAKVKMFTGTKGYHRYLVSLTHTHRLM